MRMRGSWAAALMAALVVAFLCGGVTAGPSAADTITYTDMGYTLIDLGTLGGSWSRAFAINKKGQVIGVSTTAGDLEQHAFLYSDGTMTDLGTLGGTYSNAYAINDKEEVVGWSCTAGDWELHAFLYSKGTMTDLGTLGGWWSYATDINKRGMVVGAATLAGQTTTALDFMYFRYSKGGMTDLLGTLGGSLGDSVNREGQVAGGSTTSGQTTAEHEPWCPNYPFGDFAVVNKKGQVAIVGYGHGAFLYSEQTSTDLGTLGGSWSTLYDLNDKGQVVGESSTAGDLTVHAFLYSKGTMTDLGTLGGSWSRAFAVNEKGQVVGDSLTAGGSVHAFLYSKGTMIDLGTLGGSYSWGAAINDKGQVIGFSATAGDLASHSFLYSDGTMTDLTQVVYDLFLVEDFHASDLNANQIVGSGNWDGNAHAYILTVPKNSVATD